MRNCEELRYGIIEQLIEYFNQNGGLLAASHCPDIYSDQIYTEMVEIYDVKKRAFSVIPLMEESEPILVKGPQPLIYMLKPQDVFLMSIIQVESAWYLFDCSPPYESIDIDVENEPSEEFDKM